MGKGRNKHLARKNINEEREIKTFVGKVSILCVRILNRFSNEVLQFMLFDEKHFFPPWFMESDSHNFCNKVSKVPTKD